MIINRGVTTEIRDISWMDYRLGRGCDKTRHGQQEAEWKVGRERFRLAAVKALGLGTSCHRAVLVEEEYVLSIGIV